MGSSDTSDVDCVLMRVSSTMVVRGLNHLYEMTMVQFEMFHGNRL